MEPSVRPSHASWRGQAGALVPGLSRGDSGRHEVAAPSLPCCTLLPLDPPPMETSGGRETRHPGTFLSLSLCLPLVTAKTDAHIHRCFPLSALPSCPVPFVLCTPGYTDWLQPAVHLLQKSHPQPGTTWVQGPRVGMGVEEGGERLMKSFSLYPHCSWSLCRNPDDCGSPW